MVIIRLMGGLGNQMFQYAFGKRMALVNKTELVLDQSLLLDKSKPHELVTHRNFDLNILNLSEYRWATAEEIFAYNGNPSQHSSKRILRKIKNIFYPKKLIVQFRNDFQKEHLLIKDDVCYVGRWQNELYFKDVSEQIKKEFIITAPLNEEILFFENKIKNCNSVCLHIRRSDLITSPIYSLSIGALTLDYFIQAINHLRNKVEKPTFFIFSDDKEWCKQNIILPEQVFYMDETTSGKKAEGHLYLMQQCTHFIISNSTFAWWAAWLGEKENSVIIAPKQWTRDDVLMTNEIVPLRWTKITNYFEKV